VDTNLEHLFHHTLKCVMAFDAYRLMKVFSSIQITVLTITNTGSQLIYGLYTAIKLNLLRALQFSRSYVSYDKNNNDLKNRFVEE
jgi:hypothetical protein